MKYNIIETKKEKFLVSRYCNYIFNKLNGMMITWGETKDEDPAYSPFGPFIADIEVSTICHGINNKPCTFCYKSNTGKGENMSLNTFKTIFNKLPRTLTQIAFGIGDIDSNPDLFEIMAYCRNNEYNQVVPNITINGWNLTEEYTSKLNELAGAVAVSRYGDGNVCYDAVEKLTSKGMKQINIHMMVAEETYESCLQTINDAKSDPRLSKLNAIVFLSMKPKGKRNTFHVLKDATKYKALIDLAFEKGVAIGFDSCSAPKFLEAIKDNANYKQLETLTEPCESMLFSIYINHKGETVPCSFMEGEDITPINLLEVKDFLKEVWYNEITKEFRDKLLKNTDCRNCRKCPKFDIY